MKICLFKTQIMKTKMAFNKKIKIYSAIKERLKSITMRNLKLKFKINNLIQN